MKKRGIITILIFIALFIAVIYFVIDSKNKEEVITYESQVYDFTDTSRFCKSVGRTNSYCIFSITDNAGKRVENVCFEIYEKHHISLGMSYSNMDGKAGFSGMEDETYYIRIVSTPDGYENHNVEYAITSSGANNCFKKNIKINKADKIESNEYITEDIEPFKRNSSLPINIESYNFITRYGILLDDKFEGMAVRIKFGDVVADEEYSLKREVFLEIDNAEIISYLVTPSGDREDYAKILDLHGKQKSEFNGKESFYVATMSYITEGNLDFIITFEKNGKKYKVKLTNTYSLISDKDYGRLVVNTLNEEQTQIQGENGIYKLYDEENNAINFPEHSASGATISYLSLKPGWYRVDRIINNKVIENKKFLVENNFITNIWM